MVRMSGRSTVATLLLVTVTFFTATTTAAPPVEASCIGPMLQVSDAAVTGPVDRGQTLVVTGLGWGDDCYDTGVPPGGQGTLGHPLRNISIVFVQGDRQLVVARGDADRDYAFRVRITVPPSLEPGPVRLVARHGSQDVEVAGTRSPSSPPGTDPTAITVSSAPATGRPRQLAGFGDRTEPDGDAPAPTDQVDHDQRTAVSYSLVLLAVIGGVGLIAGLAVKAARSR